MLKLVLVLSCFLALGAGHDAYPGKCPKFEGMSGFEWDKFATGKWYVTNKFGTKSSCLTYTFKTDEIGFKTLEQRRQLPYTGNLGFDHEYKVTGKLMVPQESDPASMIARFPLNVLGSASYVVLDTDYDTYGLVCTCQDVDLFITNLHRVSCSMLQRDRVESEQITQQLKEKVGSKYQHDFDHIKQDNCRSDEEDGKVWDIDVDRVIESISSTDDKLKEVVSDVTSSFEGSQTTVEDLKDRLEQIEEAAKNPEANAV